MKKILILASYLLLFSALSAQEEGLLEFFGGKYRAILQNAPGIRSVGCNSIVTVKRDSVIYTILGHEQADQFQIMAVRGSEVIMRQCFYMNGEIVSDASSLGNWFDDGTLKLKSFLRDVFNIDVSKLH